MRTVNPKVAPRPPMLPRTSYAPKETARNTDPHLGLRFWVELGGVQIAGFMECSGLSIETEVFEYQEGGQNTYTHKLPVRTKYSNITLKRGLDEEQDFFRWYMQTVEGPIQRRNITIVMYDSRQNPTYRWEFRGAYPVKWTGPDLKADASAVAVETVEIAHAGLLPTSGQVRAEGRPGPSF